MNSIKSKKVSPEERFCKKCHQRIENMNTEDILDDGTKIYRHSPDSLIWHYEDGGIVGYGGYQGI